jgi:hypothetical protein
MALILSASTIRVSYDREVAEKKKKQKKERVIFFHQIPTTSQKADSLLHQNSAEPKLTMTTVQLLCSQTICQKSATVDGSGA